MATVLTIIPYRFYPPIGGGALRCYYLLKAMAQEHKVIVLTSQPKNEFADGNTSEFFNNVKIKSYSDTKPFRSIFNVLPERISCALNFRYIKRTLKGPVDSSLFKIFPVLNSLLKENSFDIVFYENLEALDLLGDIIERKSPNSIKVYDAHNVDSELWLQKSYSDSNSIYSVYSKKALRVEESLYKRVNTFFCCSEIDRVKLLKLNKGKVNGVVIPNGVSIEERPYDSSNIKYLIKNLIFCGSLNYFPNKEGLFWFYKKVFPYLKKKQPEITLTIIGAVSKQSDYDFLKFDPSVKFIGQVDNVIPYYKGSSVAIVPLLSGSGTRLKVLEAMGMGNPVVSTTIGAEGISFLHGEHLFVSDEPIEFAEKILTLLRQKSVFEKTRSKARAHVETQYNWMMIGKSFNEEISKLMK